MLIDTHTHLYYEKFQPDLDDVITRAKQAGVTQVINIGADLKSSEQAIKFKNPRIVSFATIGIHPHEAENFRPERSRRISIDESIHENVGKLEQLSHTQQQQIVAIGECGLDYYFDGNNPDVPSIPLSQERQIELQKKLFLAQIGLVKKLNLPLIIHCRDGWHDIFFPQLKGTRGTFHHFTSNLDDAKKALDLGYCLSFSCVVTYPKNAYLRQIIKIVPLDRILTETDSPFLPPQTKRGQRNEPVNVTEVVKMIAEVKNLSFDDVAQQTFINAQRLFQLN